MQQADERKHKRELLDLQKRHMDSEDKLRDGQIGELKRKLTQGDFRTPSRSTIILTVTGILETFINHNSGQF